MCGLKRGVLMKKGKSAFSAGVALAVVLGGLYLACTLAYLLLGNAVEGIAKAMFHGVALSVQPLTLGGVIAGLAGWVVVGMAAGYAFAAVYEKLQ